MKCYQLHPTHYFTINTEWYYMLQCCDSYLLPPNTLQHNGMYIAYNTISLTLNNNGVMIESILLYNYIIIAHRQHYNIIVIGSHSHGELCTCNDLIIINMY